MHTQKIAITMPGDIVAAITPSPCFSLNFATSPSGVRDSMSSSATSPIQ
jgi:hypothetical protein